MARIRTVKPEVAKHDLLYDAEIQTGLPLRFAWVILFTVADREGRFSWRPRRLKVEILPYDEIDFSRVLDAWVTRGLLVKYRVGDAWFGWIPTFRKHQVINNREAASDIPPVDDADEVIDNRNNVLTDASTTREVQAPDSDCARTRGREGKGREGEGRAKRFTPPTIEEVHEYVIERASNVNPQRFHDFYTANGWVQGKGKPVKDWKACVRTWEGGNESAGPAAEAAR